MNTRHCSWRRFVLAASVLLSAGPASAQESEVIATAGETTTIVDGMVVTASRGLRDPDTVPNNLTVITRGDLESSGATTVPEALRQMAGVQVRDLSANGSQASVDIYGFGESAAINNLNTVVLIDGMRANVADQAAINWATINLANVERIEVLRGGGAVLYGDHATGGVINIITRQGGPNGLTLGMETDTWGWRSLASLRYQVGELRLTLSNGHGDTRGYRENGDYRHDNLHLGLLLRPTESPWSVDMSAGYTQEKYGLPGALFLPAIEAGIVDRRDTMTPDDRAERDSTYVTVMPRYEIGSETLLQLGLSYRERLSRAEYFFFGTGFPVADRHVLTGISPQLVHSGDLLGLGNTLTIGMDHQVDEMHNLDNRTESEQVVDDYFIHDSLEVIEDLYLDAGYRWSRVDYTFDGFEDPDFDLYAWSLGLTWNYQPGSKVFVNYERGYRTPVLDEFIVYPSFPGAPFINPDMEPQITRTLQAGIKHRFGPRLTPGITVFQLETDHEIFYDPSDPSFNPGFPGANRNYDETTRRGVTVELVSELTETLKLFANYTWLKAELGEDDGATNYDGNRIPLTAEHSASSGLRWQLPGNFTWDLVGRWTNTQYSLSDWDNSLKRMPAYAVFDTRLSWQYKALTLYGGVKNLLDEEYYEVASYGLSVYPAAERVFLMGAELNFTF